MGTRSNIRVYDEYASETALVNIYQQYDGYRAGVGNSLMKFLDGMVIVNGLGQDTPEKIANGMGCLAAQLVSHYKIGVGGTYLVPLDQDEEYTYEVSLRDGKLHVVCRSDDEVLYDGPVLAEVFARGI